MAGQYNYRNAKRDEGPQTFWLSTRDIQQFLQERLDMVVTTLRRESEKYANIGDISLRVAGVRVSTDFGVIAVILPPAALESEVINREGVPSIYLQKDEEAELKLIGDIEKLFKLYSFTKANRKAFYAPDVRHRYKLTRSDAKLLSHFSVPRYHMLGGQEQVMFFLNITKVFKDMLTQDGVDEKRYEVSIINEEKIRDSEYKYHVKKERIKRYDADKPNPLKEIDGMFRHKS